MTCERCKWSNISTYDIRRKGYLFCCNKNSEWYINKQDGVKIYVKKDFECERVKYEDTLLDVDL